MKGEFLSLETAELLANQSKEINVVCKLDEAEYEAKINDILDNYMDKINEMIINDENEFIIKLLLQRINKTIGLIYDYQMHEAMWGEEPNPNYEELLYSLTGKAVDKE